MALPWLEEIKSAALMVSPQVFVSPKIVSLGVKSSSPCGQRVQGSPCVPVDDAQHPASSTPPSRARQTAVPSSTASKDDKGKASPQLSVSAPTTMASGVKSAQRSQGLPAPPPLPMVDSSSQQPAATTRL
eukprot:scaffold34610_cov197-Amphora_coffeaeformis.AAC.6